MKTRRGSLLKRGRNWYVRWKVDGRAYIKVLRDKDGNPITTRRDAETAKESFMARFRHSDEAEVLQAIAGRVAGLEAEAVRLDDESSPALTIQEGWAAYLKSHNRPDTGESTLRQYAMQYRQWAEWMGIRFPRVGALREVTTDHAERFMDHLAREKRTPNTMNKYRGLLALVFRVLKDKARITVNPWESITPKGLKTESRRELTLAELRTVCESATGELRPLFALGLYTGLRLGDCATLKWSEVDLERGIIRRVPNKSRKGKPVLVPIHPVLRGVLGELSRSGLYLLPETAADYLRHSSNVTRRVQDHFASCGIETAKAGTGFATVIGDDGKVGKQHTGKRAVVEVGFHSLRHSFVSLSRTAGIPLAVVEAIVGHSNPAMTRHYTHVGEDAALSAVAALPCIIGEQVQPTAPLTDREVVILQRLEAMSGETWKQDRADLLALLKPEPVAVEVAS